MTTPLISPLPHLKWTKNFAAVHSGDDLHLLDHLAPLAILLQIPLIISEEKSFHLAKKFYPQAKIELIEDLERNLKPLIQFDGLIESKYWKEQTKWIFEFLFQKKMKLIFCPHGQSDKGFDAPVLAPYSLQDHVFVYGQLMLDMLKKLKIESPPYTVVGNYRYHYYKENISFYNSFALPLDPKKKTLFYAPTWDDLDHGSSFFSQGKRVIKELPNDWNLIFKPHPSLKKNNPVEYYKILGENLPNLFVVEDFPLIYPLIFQSDYYLGDSSSVGYDFLVREKPMALFPSKKTSLLHSCADWIDPEKNIYLQLEKLNGKTEEQRKLYAYAFHPTPAQSGG